MEKRFSERHGYRPPPKEITIREEAPEELRAAVLAIPYEFGLRRDELSKIICRVLRKPPDPYNWSEAHVYLMECEWFEVYDILEAIYSYLKAPVRQVRAESDYDPFRYHDEPLYEKLPLLDPWVDFESRINDYFAEAGIGWQMVNGKIQTRGSEAFEALVNKANEALTHSQRPTAAAELHEALQDLSRRPGPDLTGAIQHSMAALECVARDICGDPRATLGEILKRYPDKLNIPKPLDEAVTKAWGYASEVGRHIREGRVPIRSEAELIVGICAAVTTYLCQKKQGHPPVEDSDLPF